MTRRATISDVAAAANVSRAAVSKVLQGAYGVSDDMRQRVNTAIEQLNYRPLVSARGLRGATFTFGITIPDFRNHFFSEVIRGAVEFLADTPYQLLTSPVDQGHREGYRAIEALYDRQVDGILTISPLVETAWLEDMALRVPVVELGRHDIAKNYDVVRGDDAAGTRAVMEHLFSLGHTRIAHVAQVDAEASGADVTPPAIRRRVYEELMRDAGLAENIQIIEALYQEMSAYHATKSVIDHGLPPTAIFAGNDDAALGVLRATAERGVDLSVCGYDDSQLADHPLINLTSVNQHGADMGRVAMELLVERVKGRTESRVETMHPVLIARGSTRPA